MSAFTSSCDTLNLKRWHSAQFLAPSTLMRFLRAVKGQHGKVNEYTWDCNRNYQFFNQNFLNSAIVAFKLRLQFRQSLTNSESDSLTKSFTDFQSLTDLLSLIDWQTKSDTDLLSLIKQNDLLRLTDNQSLTEC